MNKQCTSSSCRRTFSTLIFGGRCPFCGKIYPSLERKMRRVRGVAVRAAGCLMIVDLGRNTCSLRKDGHLANVSLSGEIWSGSKITAIKDLRKETSLQGIALSLREAKECVEAIQKLDQKRS